MLSTSNKTALLIMLLVLVASAHAATNGAACNDTRGAQLYVDNAVPYADNSSAVTFSAYYLDSTNHVITGNHTSVLISFGNSSYNMTPSGNAWTATVVSNSREDVTFTIDAENDYYKCLHGSWTTKWRVPFYVSFMLYKTTLNSSDPQPYSDDFQYVALTNDAEYKPIDASTWTVNHYTSELLNGVANALGSKNTVSSPKDNRVYFWGEYRGGIATIKLYEPGNYSVYVINNKVAVPSSYFQEFNRPVVGDEPSYMGNILTHFTIADTIPEDTPYTLNNSVYKVYVTRTEVNRASVWTNYAIEAVIGVLFIVGLIIVVAVAGNMPGGWRIIVGYIGIGGIIALGFIIGLPH